MRSAARVICVLATVLPGVAQVAFAQSFSVQGGLQYTQRRDWRDAFNYAQAWVRAQPNTPDAWYFLSTVQENTGQLQGAIESGKRAVQLDPSKWPYWYPLCESYLGMGTRVGYEELARACAGELARRATLDWEWFETGNVYMSLGEVQPSFNNNAKAAFERDLRLNPRASGAWQNLGNTEWRLGNLKNAEDDFRRAIQLGDTAAENNLNQLQSEIQECYSDKQSIDHTQNVLLGVVTAYNARCGSISGSIPVRIIRVP